MACCTSPIWPGAVFKHPSEVLAVGDEVDCQGPQVRYSEKNRVSLGLKQLGEDPWVGIKVTSLP